MCASALRKLPTVAIAWLTLSSAVGFAAEAKALAQLRGVDFKGGANARFGSTFHGRDDVNYVYAQPTGPASTMRATFALQGAPKEPLFLYIRITRKAAEAYKSVVKHRMILWDNYPVNDSAPTMHLGPVTGRDPDLCEVIEGYMSNPLCPQNEINRVPLLTCADYAYNPRAYDPARSIGQAIVHLAETDSQRQALKDLVEAYPGMLIFGGSTGVNPVRERFKRLAAAWDSRPLVQDHIGRMEGLASRFSQAFPDRFHDAQKTLAADIASLKAAAPAKPE